MTHDHVRGGADSDRWEFVSKGAARSCYVSFIGLVKVELSSILTISRKSLVFRINFERGNASHSFPVEGTTSVQIDPRNEKARLQPDHLGGSEIHRVILNPNKAFALSAIQCGLSRWLDGLMP
jgi:hypothetical protein